jgi:hypothetical protein
MSIAVSGNELVTSIGSTIFIRDISIRPFQRATIKLYYRDGCDFQKYNLSLEGSEYTSWGSDDSYLIDWILRKVCGPGVTLA